ncbi:MAG: response regulator transcription factor [Actinobacteria bacterium]|nr:response regulator transcription factor [Actinomycetota bacterium]
MRVLVIEDDDAIRSVVERGLRAEGFEVDTCSDGAEGLWKALDGGYAAIVLDLLLPGMNGYSVCARLREEGNTTPILVLTAKSGEYDQIDLLDSGADDFLTKPASIAVIAARLRVLVRRNAALASNVVLRGELRYDMGTRDCVVAGESRVLTAREDQVLRRLLLANGACVTRQELLDDVWGPDAGIDASNLDIHVRRLRDKLAPVAVENVRGLGYRIGVR